MARIGGAFPFSPTGVQYGGGIVTLASGTAGPVFTILDGAVTIDATGATVVSADPTAGPATVAVGMPSVEATTCRFFRRNNWSGESSWSSTMASRSSS